MSDLNKEISPLPLPNTLPDVQSFRSEMLPDAIRDYVMDVAERQQCPPDFVAVSAICGLSAVLGRKALMNPKQYDTWSVTPNLWGALIGRPSTMKSPAMKAALNPLYEIEQQSENDYEAAIKEHMLEKEFSEINKSGIKNQARSLIKEEKKEEAKEMIRTNFFDEQLPLRKRIIINDTSVEKLGELLNENPNGLILIRDELSGWLSKITREDYQQERAFYIECFNGDGRYTFDRISRGHIEIKNLTLSLLGGIQPSKINTLIREAINGTGNDGLIQRLQLAVWPDDRELWEWIDRQPNQNAYEKYQTIFKHLHNVNFPTLESNIPQFRFSSEAQKLFTSWMIQNQLSATKDSIHPAFESHLLKMPKTIASLALLFEIVTRLSQSPSISPTANQFTVSDASITYAIAWAHYLKSHANRIYSIVTKQGLEGAHLILARINKLENSFTVRDIYRKGWIGLTEDHAIQEALDYLVDDHHLVAEEISTTERGGRPTIKYHKHQIYLARNP